MLSPPTSPPTPEGVGGRVARGAGASHRTACRAHLSLAGPRFAGQCGSLRVIRLAHARDETRGEEESAMTRATTPTAAPEPARRRAPQRRWYLPFLLAAPMVLTMSHRGRAATDPLEECVEVQQALDRCFAGRDARRSLARSAPKPPSDPADREAMRKRCQADRDRVRRACR